MQMLTGRNGHAVIRQAQQDRQPSRTDEQRVAEWHTHPAMLAAHGFNSDVQLPYRLPICAETITCDGKCLESVDEDEMILASQLAQDAQAGYACDYCNKRQHMAFSGAKECLRGSEASGSAWRMHGHTVR